MRLLLVSLLALAALMTRAAEADVLASLRPDHPRLLLTDEQLAAAVAAAKTDPLRAQLHARIIAVAEAELASRPIAHVLIGPRLLDKSRTCVGRVLTCALAFRLTGDERFFRRARKEMLTAAEFPDWNPSHFLDVAEMSFALAIGYDWLHAKLTPDERAAIKGALLKHGLALAPNAYAPGGATDQRVKRWVTAHHNWNQVCNAGMLAAALALAEDEPALARLVVTGAVKSLPRAMEAYQPDGAYPEGPGYWGYGTSYNVIAIAALESALGTDFNLSRVPGFDRTALYRLHIQSPAGLAFNYADGGANIGAQPEYTWLAARFHHTTALAHSRMLLIEATAKMVRIPERDRLFALNAVWFPAAQSGEMGVPLDVRFRGPAELAIFRSAWNDPRALFLGFKAGRNDVNHAHLDLGSFVLDADGVRWAQDLGPDDYNLPDYFGKKRWTYYRLNNHSHNTLTPAGALQDPKALAPLIAFASASDRAFAVADLTGAYPGVAKKILRGVALLDRARVLVQDDLTGVPNGTALTSRLLLSAKIQLSADARTATLTLDGRTLRAAIMTPANAKFSVAAATPANRTENLNKGVTALTAEFTADSADTRLAILLTPVGDHWPAALQSPALTSLVDWK